MSSIWTSLRLRCVSVWKGRIFRATGSKATTSVSMMQLVMPGFSASFTSRGLRGRVSRDSNSWILHLDGTE